MNKRIMRFYFCTVLGKITVSYTLCLDQILCMEHNRRQRTRTNLSVKIKTGFFSPSISKLTLYIYRVQVVYMAVAPAHFPLGQNGLRLSVLIHILKR